MHFSIRAGGVMLALCAGASWTYAAPPEDGLGDIVVTARKRAETAQSVPIAIQTLAGSALERQNVTSLQGLSGRLPNVGVEPSPGTGTAAAVSLRGISTYDFELYVDPPIAVYVDGVVYARPQMLNVDNLVDIDRVEVLYGPQGTLFGRNTTGGAINITTRIPREDLHVRASVGYGSNNEFTARAVVETGRFAKFLRAKLVYAHREIDGYQRNLNTDRARSPNASNSEYVAATLIADPAPDFTLSYRFDRTANVYRVGGSQMVDATGDVIRYFGASPLYGGQPLVISKDYLDAFYQRTAFPASRATVTGHAFTASWTPSPAFSLKNIFAYRTMRIDEINSGGAQGFLRGPTLDPVTYAPIGIQDITTFFTPRLNDRARDLTEELQATGEIGDVDYAAGFFYFRERSRGDNINRFTVALPGGMAGLNLETRRLYALKTDSYAGYAQASWRPGALDGRLELTAGLRYTVDHKGLEEALFSLGAPAGAQRLRNRWSNLSENVSASYRLAERVMVYGRIGSGYKAGGYNPGTLQPAYGPEEATVYELGLKSELLDRRLRFNAAAFRTVYDKIQVGLLEITPTSNSTVITNAAAARYTGFEASIVALPAHGMQIEANIGYVDPHYTRFDYRDPATLELIDVADEARSPLTSKWTGGGALQQTFGIAGLGEVTARIEYSYRSRRYYFALDRQNPRNRIVSGNPQHNLRASVSIAQIPLADPSRLRLDVWGNNLLDEKWRIGGIDFGALGFGTVAYDRPKSIGATATIEY